MSIENRPNLNAVGLLCAVIDGLENTIRGEAGRAGMKEVMPLLKDEMQKFVEVCDEVLNNKFGFPLSSHAQKPTQSGTVKK